jgi:hypothetical protein
VRKDDGCACGRAIQKGQQIVIHDVEAEEAFAPFRKAAAEAGYRAVQSTPLITDYQRRHSYPCRIDPFHAPIYADAHRNGDRQKVRYCGL